MNVLIVSYVYPHRKDPRLGLFVHEQAKELVRQKNKVTVITAGEFKERKIIDGIRIDRLKVPQIVRGFVFSIKNLVYLSKLKANVDIVHLHFIGMGSFFCWVGCRFKNLPLVATVHGIDVCPKNFFHGILLRFYLLFPKRVMAVSNYTKKLTSELTNEKKIVVVNNGVDLEKLRPNQNREAFKRRQKLKGKKVLLSIGGLVERKGHDRVIRALPGIVNEFPNLIYLIVGKGKEENNLKKLAESLGVEKNVRFLGYVSNEDVGNYLNICDIFVLMSRTIKNEGGIEGFGIVFIEASAIGKPVIGGKSGGTADSIKDKVTGFRINPNDRKELQRKIVLLLRNKRLKGKMEKEGKRRVLKEFLWKHNVKKTLKVYRSALI